MQATAAPEEGNKVRLSVVIDDSEIDKALDSVVKRLASEVRVPGFRPGKVPRRIIEARMGGAAAMRGEALREALPDFYAQAVLETEVDPIDQPKIDIISGDDGGPVAFDAVVEVRPSVSIAGYQGLVITIPSLNVPAEDITAQIDRLRATSGELVEVDRAIENGDQVTLDIRGTRQGDDASDDLMAEDFLYEVGKGGVVPELDVALLGATANSSITFESTPEELGTTISFTVAIKDVKELVLPDLDDAWAAEASEFDTVEALTADITERLKQVRRMQATMALQQKTVEALVELVSDDIPAVMVEDELRERLHDLGHRLDQQGISISQFLSATGRDEQEFLDELRARALEGVKADLALRALVEAESTEVTDEELDEELASMGTRLEMSVDSVREQLDRSGRLSAVRSDRRRAKALRWLVDSVELVDEEGNPVSRDDLLVKESEEDTE